MILVKTCRKGNKLVKISVRGHANYDEFGKDIVCAAVSSICLCSVRAIMRIDESAILVNARSGKLDITVNSYDDITLKLLDNLMSCLMEIAENYPNNIQIK